MRELCILIKRDTKLFFKDKGMFFSAMVTPLILLLLYISFLGNVYRDSFASAIPQGVILDQKLINALVGGQLVSSLLAVCCVTVAFCSNLLMVQDKVSGARKDFMVTPVKSSKMALAYYIATLVSTLLICYVAAGAGLGYIGKIGWYLSVKDVIWLLMDVFLLVLFGTALSSVINFFLTSQGQISAVGTIISAGYGFICGAYMPISQFGSGLRKVICMLPGTYGTSLLKNHTLQGVFEEMEKQGIPTEMTEMFRDTVDCNLYVNGNKVEISTMYLVVCGSIVLLVALYIFMNRMKKR